VIVGEFGMEKFFGPRGWVCATKDSEISFYFLVNTFNLPIRLEVVGGGERKVVVQKFSKFSSKGRCELRTTIRDNFIVKPKVEENLMEEKRGDAFV